MKLSFKNVPAMDVRSSRQRVIHAWSSRRGQASPACTDKPFLSRLLGLKGGVLWSFLEKPVFCTICHSLNNSSKALGVKKGHLS